MFRTTPFILFIYHFTFPADLRTLSLPEITKQNLVAPVGLFVLPVTLPVPRRLKPVTRLLFRLFAWLWLKRSDGSQKRTLFKRLPARTVARLVVRPLPLLTRLLRRLFARGLASK